jgi:hypothetical protein
MRASLLVITAYTACVLGITDSFEAASALIPSPSVDGTSGPVELTAPAAVNVPKNLRGEVSGWHTRQCFHPQAA